MKVKVRIGLMPRQPFDGKTRRVCFVLALLLPTLPAGNAHACSACTMSIVNLLFPFMWEATWVLGGWRILYLFFQIGSIISNPVRFVGRELGILFFLYLGFWWACFFLYFLGYLLYAIYQSLRFLAPLKSGWAPRIVLSLNLLTIAILVPIAVNAYTTFFQRDALDQLRHYVYPGTSQSRSLTLHIAEDQSLDLARIRQMLASPDPHDSQKALEVLYRRNQKQDLIELQDVILGIMDSDKPDEFIDARRESVWLVMWLESLAGKEIRSAEDLEIWLNRNASGPVD